jgi:hypothetical protein
MLPILHTYLYGSQGTVIIQLVTDNYVDEADKVHLLKVYEYSNIL